MSNCQFPLKYSNCWNKPCPDNHNCKDFTTTPRMTNEEFASTQTEILKDIPEEFKSALSYMAYERGHSAGNEEIVNELRGLVSDLQQAIEDYTKRITTK